MSLREQFDGLVVVKVGSSTLTNESGAVDRDVIADLCEQLARLRAEGHPVIVVT